MLGFFFNIFIISVSPCISFAAWWICADVECIFNWRYQLKNALMESSKQVKLVHCHIVLFINIYIFLTQVNQSQITFILHIVVASFRQVLVNSVCSVDSIKNFQLHFWCEHMCTCVYICVDTYICILTSKKDIIWNIK